VSRRPSTPWSELARLQERLNLLFEQALVGAGEELHEEGAAGCWRPALDLVETRDALVVFVELPGVAREDVNLQVHGRWLELSGERRMHEGEHSFQRLEGCYGRFRRRVELPVAIDPDGINAELRSGVLEIRLAKPRPSPGSRVEIEERGP
jgi:HSP20 family protein